MKACSTCGEVKEEVEFYFDKSKGKYRSRCKACDSIASKTQSADAKERKRAASKRWVEENRIRSREIKKNWNKKNPDKVRLINHKVSKKRREDPIECLKDRVRSRISVGLHRKHLRKRARTEELLGCSWDKFIQIVGVPSSPGMELDHICPLAQAQNEEEVIKLCHYTNLRWLTKEENNLKGANKTVAALIMCRNILDRDWID